MTDQHSNAQRLDYLKSHISDAYEASVRVANEPNAHPLAFELSSLLNLLEHMAGHPTQTDYSADFGEYTIDLLNKLIDRCSTETFTMHTARERDILTATEIGRELLAIEEAMRQGKIAWGNANHMLPALIDAPNSLYTDSALFTELSRRREALRRELLETFGAI